MPLPRDVALTKTRRETLLRRAFAPCNVWHFPNSVISPLEFPSAFGFRHSDFFSPLIMQSALSLFFGRQRPASLKRQGMYRSVLEGMLATVHITLVQGAFLTNFVLFLGANNFTISIITAIPFLVQASYFLSPILTGKFHSRRKVAAVCSAIGRSLWLFSGAIAFLPISSGAKVACFIATLAAGSALEVIGQNAWQSWMADLVARGAGRVSQLAQHLHGSRGAGGDGGRRGGDGLFSARRDGGGGLRRNFFRGSAVRVERVGRVVAATRTARSAAADIGCATAFSNAVAR
jgi:hypothetical protein